MIDAGLLAFVWAIWGWVFGRKIWVVGSVCAGLTRSLTRDSPAPFASAAGIPRISYSCSSSTCLDLRRACSHASCEQVCKLGLVVATFADALCVQMPFGLGCVFLCSCMLLVAWLCTSTLQADPHTPRACYVPVGAWGLVLCRCSNSTCITRGFSCAFQMSECVPGVVCM